MKILHILTFLIFINCTRSSIIQQVNIPVEYNEEVNTNDKVEFLSVSQGALAILDETYEPYFTNLQIREIHALTGILPPTTNLNEARDFAREKFSSAVTSFTLEEKSAILFVTSVVKETLQGVNLDLIANHPWKFIKIENWLCGGFAHTRGDYIILSQLHIKHLTSSWSEEMSLADSAAVVKNLGSLLVHEQFHSLQRKYPEKYESLYVDSWNFKKADVEVDSTILVNQLINPDAPMPEWIIDYNGVYYWIRTLINANSAIPQMGRDFNDVVFTLEQKNNHFFVAKDSLGNLKKQKILEFTSYTNCFPVKHGLDHPNEISAYMFSKYFIAIVEEKIPFDDVDEKAHHFSQKYLTWLKNAF